MKDLKNMDDNIKKTLEQFPFLSYGEYLEQEYLGIIGNSDNQFLSMYIFNLLPSDDLKKEFIYLGEIWWWESNRTIGINLFHHAKWSIFRPYLRTFIRKDFNLIHGPCVSLQDIISKRIKKRSITLFRPEENLSFD